jgi:lipopolysaccharide transport system permease protein
LFIVLALMTSLGPGILLSALGVRYRDFRFVVPFIVQIGLYISPVGFSSSIVPQSWRLLYDLNPIVGVIDGFRWCISGPTEPFPVASVALTLLVSSLLLILGIRYFRSIERAFADVI